MDLRYIALMLWLGTSALLIGVFDIKHYLHLQVRLSPVTPLECWLKLRMDFCVACTSHDTASPGPLFSPLLSPLLVARSMSSITERVVLEVPVSSPHIHKLQRPSRCTVTSVQREYTRGTSIW